MLQPTIKIEGLEELQKSIRGTKRDIKQETAIAINKTAKKIKTSMSKQVRKRLAAKAGEVNKTIKVSRKANKSKLGSTVNLEKNTRLPLKAFGARQIRKGVSYKIDKTKGRKVVPGAFMGPKPGMKAARLYGHAWKRTRRTRTPIVKLYGLSSWGTYTKNNMRNETVIDGRKELRKQIDNRVRFILLKKQGLI